MTHCKLVVESILAGINIFPKTQYTLGGGLDPVTRYWTVIREFPLTLPLDGVKEIGASGDST